MNNSMQTIAKSDILNAISIFSANKEKYSFSAHKGDDPEVYIMHIIDSMHHDKSNSAHFFFIMDIGFTISHELLYEAYQKKHNSFKYDVTQNEEEMMIFVKNKAVEIVKHLKDFNLVADNYEAIADLLQLSRGAIWGERYGI